MLRVLSYNIRRGGIGREQALSETIEACAPDIVVFQEATQPAIIRSLAETARMAHWGATPKWSLGFMSRVPLADARWRRPQVSRHAFLEIVPDGSSFTIFGVHLSAVFSAWTEQRRVFELRALLRSVRLHQRGFHALVGDFNTIAPGELLNPESLPRRVRATMWLSGGRIRWRTIQTVLDGGYADAFRALHPADPGLTLPAVAPQVRLDYVFVPSGQVDRVRQCNVIDSAAARRASDHLPLLALLDIS